MTLTTRVAAFIALSSASGYAHGWVAALATDKRIAAWCGTVSHASYLLCLFLCFALVPAGLLDAIDRPD